MAGNATATTRISPIGKVGLCLFFVLGAALVFVMNRRSVDELQPASKYFYSDDNGKSWFTDDASKLVPFDHNGRPSYRAFVYRSPDGSMFCGYLERLSDSALAQVKQLTAQSNTIENEGKIAQASAFGKLVKKPGDSTWVSLATRDGSMVLAQPPKVQPVEP